jgi:hypothetical protein
MPHVRLGRLFVVAALAAVPALAGAAPARAADPPELAIVLPGVTVPVGDSGTPVTPQVTTTARLPIGANTTTYELDALGELSAPQGSGCERPTAKRVVCRAATGRYLYPDTLNALPTVTVKAAEPAAGAGELRVTFAVDGMSALTAKSRVRTAEGVDLAALGSTMVSVPFGGSMKVPAKVRNQGDGVARGVAVLFTYALPFQVKSSKTAANCWYAGDVVVACLFDQELAAGRSYQADVPYRIREDASSPREGRFPFFHQLWLTPAELEDLGTLGTPGTGGELTLAELPEALADPQADEEKSNNATSIGLEVTGPRRWIDLEGIGDKVSGERGDLVKVTVGFRNLGPAAFIVGDPVESHFKVPPGTTVVGEISPDCHTISGGVVERPAEPGRSRYICYALPDHPVGSSTTLDFQLRIDKVIPNAAGAFLAGGGPCQRECPIFQSDTDVSNNEAPVIVNARATPPDGDGGSGGGLPVTGPTGALLAAVGLACLAGGVLLLVAGRRRVIQ